MASSGHPVVRAASFVAAARLGQVGWDRIEDALTRARDPLDVETALWEAAYQPQQPPPAVVEVLRRWVGSLDPRLAWAASRSALVHGDREPYRWLLSSATFAGSGATEDRPSLADVLGVQAVEMVAFVGRHEDSSRLTRWLRRVRPTPSVLDALARFGNVEIWGYLVSQLGDDDLKEPAAGALELLFGQCVPETERQDPASWRAAIARLDLDPRRRLRLGVPFAPHVLDREIRLGEASRAGLEARQAELCARHRRLPCRALHGVADDVEASLTQAVGSWSRVGGDRAGQWI
jgi:hypothetical protein